jgi:ribosomal protein S27AE
VLHNIILNYYILNKAVINGLIEKPMSCSDCGNITRLAAHHNDYNKALDVEWLCYECHGKRHRKIISAVGMGD